MRLEAIDVLFNIVRERVPPAADVKTLYDLVVSRVPQCGLTNTASSKHTQMKRGAYRWKAGDTSFPTHHAFTQATECTGSGCALNVPAVLVFVEPRCLL
jgi:hypothetical protein